MSIFVLERRALLAGLAAAAFAAPAACAATPPEAAPKAVPETTPDAALEPLEIVTAQGRTRFLVEIADDDYERARGLMYRRALAPDRGMLFDFHTSRPVAFWMRNTYIPLDMIFIRQDGTILSVAHNVQPLSDRQTPSGGPVRAVLEVIAGRARQIGALPGDRIVHRIFPDG